MKEYLRIEITEDKLERRKDFVNDISSLTKRWKDKYAVKRIANFIKNDREFNLDTLFYDDLVTLSWEETKEKYLKEVGR